MARLLTHLLPGGADGSLPVMAAGQVAGADPQADPYDSGMWPYHRQDHLGDPQDWHMDPLLLLLAPESAEDASHVPILVDATGIADAGRISRIVVTIDYSPFPVGLVFHPGRALPLLGFGVKYEMAGAIRASAEAVAEGAASRWSMAAAFVDAMGGGCTAPAAAHVRPDWQDGFGEMRGRLWPDSGRLRVMIRHPMDTGLAEGFSAHHLTELILRDGGGDDIARLEINEPVEENPVLTFLLPPDLARGPVSVEARDNVGYRFRGMVEAGT